ncbi:26S proteasome regulatory complex, non-ATPase subcomplex, Rpn1 subunit [Laetiporus sulphureus 93-53]|uniref:26S proteasome regulatory subunit RPN1 n=1 Tax=Laetiporus sulphureus 93-53 TaxID=1314785 RepID=A0A165GGS9_9APHY|nr:26S proteasome regulatory complex, non-ATPase subcomplex, Rpn1 subunit [Laetiporus sulphureus 93-53]KZT10323.1 26S proteasome regulatory complex, non-ATPase subcomplex, Rpn1 subunit [Laetiporus sulphureus 93-53]
MPEPTATISVTSEDPKKKKEEKQSESGKAQEAKKKGDEKEGEDLSEEDLQLKNELEMLVERLKEPNTELYRPALETLRTLIRTSTSSMTSVPKPLKFLRPHYRELQSLYEAWSPSEDKSLFADILSVLAMTYSDTEPRGTLRYRLLSASLRPASSPLSEPGSWGHEYVRHLAAELGEEYTARTLGEEAVEVTTEEPEKEKANEEPEKKPAEVVGSIDDLHALAMECATFLLHHNAEPDAVDLLEELEIVDRIVELVDENTYERVCQYMIRCVNLLPTPDDRAFLRTTHRIYVQHHKFPQALSLSIRLADPDLIRHDFNAPANPLMKRQLAFLLARAQIPTQWLEPQSSEDDVDDVESEMQEDIVECLSNTHLSEHFRDFGKELGVLEPRSLEDVYKSHLENTRTSTANVDSARANLAGTFVNAFVNAGFGNDKLMVEAEEGNSWIYKNKDHGMMSAAASLGLSLLWDPDVGLSHVDKYTYSSEEHIKAGALLATGILNTGVRTEADAALALLSEYVKSKSLPLRTSATTGLGLAYAGSHREDILQLLLPYIADDSVSMEIASLSALALGFIFVGSGNGEIASTILQTLMEREDKQLEEKWARYMILGLALLYLGLQDGSDATVETLKAIEHHISKQAVILVDTCAYAGSGDVLKIQEMLHHCDEHVVKPSKDDKDKDKDAAPEEPPKDDTFQAFAVLGIALVAMGEEVGSEMSMRTLSHLMQYGEPIIRKAVPLALGLLSASNPQLPVMDTLSKYSHDNDLAVALNAIFAMGLIGAGTNNARLAQMLRQLAGYYYKEPDCLFMVRIAQGLVHMGKGTLTINPYFCDRNIMSRTAVAGLLATLIAFTDAKGFILDKYHWMLYFLAPAMYPRFLITLNEELKNFPVTVRVGQAVDVVGQAGKPRTISGFQTHSTPVRLGTTERAELATEEYIPYAHVLEGFVILEKNPGYEKEDKMEL